MAYPLPDCTAAQAADLDGVPVTLSPEDPHGAIDKSDLGTTKHHPAAADRHTTAPDHDWDGVNHNDPWNFHHDPDPDHDQDHR